MEKITEQSEVVIPARKSRIKVWLERLLVMTTLASSGSMRHDHPPEPSYHGDYESFCWGDITPNQYPPARIPIPPQPESDPDKKTKRLFAEAYFSASGHVIPDFSFESMSNEVIVLQHISHEEFKEIVERKCQESHVSSNIEFSATLQIAEIQKAGKKARVLVVRINCQLYGIDSKGNEFLADGFFLSASDIALVGNGADTSIIFHELSHGNYDDMFEEMGVDSYSKFKFTAGKILSANELRMVGLEACSPLSMDMANEMIARAIEKIKTNNDPDYVYRARFALGLNIMNRLALMIKNGTQVITEENHEQFDTYYLLSRASEWTNQPWSYDALKKLAKGNLLLVANEAPALIGILGSGFFREELDRNPNILNYIPNAVREQYWPKKNQP